MFSWHNPIRIQNITILYSNSPIKPSHYHSIPTRDSTPYNLDYSNYSNIYWTDTSASKAMKILLNNPREKLHFMDVQMKFGTVSKKCTLSSNSNRKEKNWQRYFQSIRFAYFWIVSAYTKAIRFLSHVLEEESGKWTKIKRCKTMKPHRSRNLKASQNYMDDVLCGFFLMNAEDDFLFKGSSH